jgi:hypothetical protein
MASKNDRKNVDAFQPLRDRPPMLAPFHTPAWLRLVARRTTHLTLRLSGLPSTTREL